MRLLVCGSRTFSDYAYFCNKMQNYGITHIIHGAARGADSFAARFASELDIPVTACPADWDKLGKRAGFVRNEFMLTLQPGFVVAFIDKPLSESKGTANMVSLAKKANIQGKIYHHYNREEPLA